MRICFTYEHKTFCFTLPPIILRPWPPTGPDPGPERGDYDQLVADATLLASIHDVTNQIADARVKEAVHTGLNRALEAAQKKAGQHVSLSFDN